MKYNEMSGEQREAFKGLLLMALTVKTQEEKPIRTNSSGY